MFSKFEIIGDSNEQLTSPPLTTFPRTIINYLLRPERRLIMRKVTSIFLSILFIISLIPIEAFALNENIINNNSVEYKIVDVIDENSNTRSIARYFGTTIPVGTVANYNQEITRKSRNITVAYRTSMTLLQSNLPGEIASAVCDMFAIPSIAADVFVYAAQNSIAALAFEDADPNTMSIRIVQYYNPTHSIGGNSYYRYAISYYTKANCQGNPHNTINYYEAITYLS